MFCDTLNKCDHVLLLVLMEDNVVETLNLMCRNWNHISGGRLQRSAESHKRLTGLTLPSLQALTPLGYKHKKVFLARKYKKIKLLVCLFWLIVNKKMSEFEETGAGQSKWLLRQSDQVEDPTGIARIIIIYHYSDNKLQISGPERARKLTKFWGRPQKRYSDVSIVPSFGCTANRFLRSGWKWHLICIAPSAQKSLFERLALPNRKSPVFNFIFFIRWFCWLQKLDKVAGRSCQRCDVSSSVLRLHFLFWRRKPSSRMCKRRQEWMERWERKMWPTAVFTC